MGSGVYERLRHASILSRATYNEGPYDNRNGRRFDVADATDRRGKMKAIIRVATGNFLEMYDFMVFGYYAAAIGRTFFPKSSDFASLMLSLATFGAGFLMRPLGALVLGAYIDRQGRRRD